jgi:hypothetical protein
VQNFLSEEVKITTVAAVAAGTSTITSTALDMAGYDGALFIIRLGTPAADNSVKITQCDTTGGSYADLTGTKVGDHATDTPLIVDIKRPREQFLKYVVTRTTSTTIAALRVTGQVSTGVARDLLAQLQAFTEACEAEGVEVKQSVDLTDVEPEPVAVVEAEAAPVVAEAEPAGDEKES